VVFTVIRSSQSFRHDDGKMNSSVPKVDDGVVVSQAPSTVEPVALVTYNARSKTGKSVLKSVAHDPSGVPPSVP
jgi:hypothetical protein